MTGPEEDDEVAAIEIPLDRLRCVPLEQLRQSILHRFATLEPGCEDGEADWWLGLIRRPWRARFGMQDRARARHLSRHQLVVSAPSGADGARAGDGVE